VRIELRATCSFLEDRFSVFWCDDRIQAYDFLCKMICILTQLLVSQRVSKRDFGAVLDGLTNTEFNDVLMKILLQ